jgi:hypothetical protein
MGTTLPIFCERMNLTLSVALLVACAANAMLLCAWL